MKRRLVRTAPKRIPYHGWHIRVVAQADAFCFHCYPPYFSDFCNDGCAYGSSKCALKAACQFVDRELAIQALIEALGDCLQSGQVSQEEYWQLTNFS